jgi:hypothetical protein
MQYKKLVLEHNNPKRRRKQAVTTKQTKKNTHPKVSTGKKPAVKKKSYYYYIENYTLSGKLRLHILIVAIQEIRQNFCEYFFSLSRLLFCPKSSSGNIGVSP